MSVSWYHGWVSLYTMVLSSKNTFVITSHRSSHHYCPMKWCLCGLSIELLSWILLSGWVPHISSLVCPEGEWSGVKEELSVVPEAERKDRKGLEEARWGCFIPGWWPLCDTACTPSMDSPSWMFPDCCIDPIRGSSMGQLLTHSTDS